MVRSSEGVEIADARLASASVLLLFRDRHSGWLFSVVLVSGGNLGKSTLSVRGQGMSGALTCQGEEESDTEGITLNIDIIIII